MDNSDYSSSSSNSDSSSSPADSSDDSSSSDHSSFSDDSDEDSYCASSLSTLSSRSDNEEEVAEEAEEDEEGGGATHNCLINAITTAEDILCLGLDYVGFMDRQTCREPFSLKRFNAHYGPEPATVIDMLNVLKEKHGKISFKFFMMSLNFLKCCKCMCCIDFRDINLCDFY